jgi:hypothetical protein
MDKPLDVSDLPPAGLFSRRLARRGLVLAPIAAAIAYPFALMAFHGAVTRQVNGGTGLDGAEAVFWFAVAFLLPLSCLALVATPAAITSAPARRAALAGLAAPPLFVLTGVASGLLHSPIRDLWIWIFAWIALGGVTAFADSAQARSPPSARLRILHGVAAAVILLYVAFHLTNHLLGLFGPELHARVMQMGRKVYRQPLIEPVLVGLLLFQVASGLRMAWRWSASALSLPRAIQLGSGAYLAAFILAHMNSAFISARAVHGIDTNWAWASGAPDGLLLDAWNIRLVPHYALGVFFVIAHLFCGLRAVLLAHQANPVTVARIWGSGLVLAAIVSAAIIAALCGFRV